MGPNAGDGTEVVERVERSGVAHALRLDSGVPETERRLMARLPVLGMDAPADDGVRLITGNCPGSEVDGMETPLRVENDDDSEPGIGLVLNPASTGSGRTRGDICNLCAVVGG